MNLINILREIKKIKVSNNKKIKIVLISNITINLFKYYFEYELKRLNINCEIIIANYDNLIQESENYKKADCVIIFFELINFFLKKNTNIQSTKKKNKFIFKNLIDDFKILFKILKSTQLVIINDFSYEILDFFGIKSKKIKNNIIKLNKFISKKNNNNFFIVRTDFILKKLEIQNSIDKNNFYYSNLLYSTNYMSEYVKLIKYPIMKLYGKPKKVIILDCDNTLWKGVISEDYNDFKINFNKLENKNFYKIQKLLRSLKNKGLILCLCSKNNYNDVKNFFKKNNNMPLRFDDFTIKKINWNNKVNNIKEISKELNLGLDSFIFIDDSLFELGLVNRYLKMVETYHVSENIYKYLLTIRSLTFSLNFGSVTKEDKLRSKNYEQEQKRLLDKNKYFKIDDYINSLKIKTFYKIGKQIPFDRASQLTLRTNQFNLTTKRYNVNKIKDMVFSNNYFISTISVKDKYGDYGVTGLCIIKFLKKNAEIDTFLLSCRIIGREIENKYLNWIITYLKKKNYIKLYGNYIKSEKNLIVKNFYKNNKFKKISQNKHVTNYCLNL